jgi:hypothetical protein
MSYGMGVTVSAFTFSSTKPARGPTGLRLQSAFSALRAASEQLAWSSAEGEKAGKQWGRRASAGLGRHLGQVVLHAALQEVLPAAAGLHVLHAHVDTLLDLPVPDLQGGEAG